MHYEITASVYSGKPMSYTQKTSPFFTDCPQIGIHSIRSREPLKLSRLEFQKHEKDIKRLFLAEAIEIVEVADEGEGVKRTDLRAAIKHLEKSKKEPKKDEKKTEVVPEPVVVPEVAAAPAPVVEPVTEVVPEPVKEPEVQPEPTPATVEPTPAAHKGKKGRKE